MVRKGKQPLEKNKLFSLSMCGFTYVRYYIFSADDIEIEAVYLLHAFYMRVFVL